MNDSDSFEEDTLNSISHKVGILDSLRKFEGRLLTLVDGEFDDESYDEEDRHNIPEIIEEQRNALRDSFYTELRGLFLSSPTKGRLSSKVHHEAVYLLLSDRLSRNAGYYQALMDAQEEVRKRNLDIGDPRGLTIDVGAVQNLLSSLDEVDFVRNVGLSMGLDPDDLNKIVDCVIRKEFAPTRK